MKDTGWFDVSETKTILVGPNEAGKTAVLRTIEHLKPGPLVKAFDPLRDYPRSAYHAFQSGGATPASIIVVAAEMALDSNDRSAVTAVSAAFADVKYMRGVRLGGELKHWLVDGPAAPTYGSIKDQLRRLALHADTRVPAPIEGAAAIIAPSASLTQLLAKKPDGQVIGQEADAIREWLDATAPYVDEANDTEIGRLRSLRHTLDIGPAESKILALLDKQMPVFVYFSTYTRVTPLLHLGHLADAIDAGAINESDPYNFGNYCLLKLLGFSARELSDLGKAVEPAAGDIDAFETYRAQLDKRDVVLNAASLELTKQVKAVWQPNNEPAGTNDYVIRIKADQQYLKVVVQDSLGVEVELDQRSEGFQWLVSFFIVFFAQARDGLKGAVLLLDEPGLSLHGLKQREFRQTLSRLAMDNQTIFTTHSPFLVGPDELDIVRVVEMTDREIGTKVHTTIAAGDSASLLPLQEALGYDLAQSLFAQSRNLILEGLTDYWYIEATAGLLRASGGDDLREDVALVPASGAGKVVYFATILHAHSLKVAALLDSDQSGDQAAQQDTLVSALGNRAILRTKDSYKGQVAKPEIEDLLRATLIEVGKGMAWDVSATAASQPGRPIVDVFNAEIPDFSKYKLAKAYLTWTQDHTAADLTSDETTAFVDLVGRVNKALR